tara:strand:- start:143 stop:703 length:561 start_codon:yes stop_codon:yes gene_type:complete
MKRFGIEFEAQNRKPKYGSKNYYSSMRVGIIGKGFSLGLEHEPQSIDGVVYYNACSRMTTMDMYKDFNLRFSIEPSRVYGAITSVYMTEDSMSSDRVYIYKSTPYRLWGSNIKVGGSKVLANLEFIDFSCKDGLCRVDSEGEVITEFMVEPKNRYIMFEMDAADHVTHLKPKSTSSLVKHIELKNM